VLAENCKIYVNFYYDGEISQNDLDSAEEAMGEMMGDFWFDEEGKKVDFDYQIKRCDFPQKMPLVGNWVYYRRE
jgi:hypothetical protein